MWKFVTLLQGATALNHGSGPPADLTKDSGVEALDGSDVKPFESNVGSIEHKAPGDITERGVGDITEHKGVKNILDTHSASGIEGAEGKDDGDEVDVDVDEYAETTQEIADAEAEASAEDIGGESAPEEAQEEAGDNVAEEEEAAAALIMTKKRLRQDPSDEKVEPPAEPVEPEMATPEKSDDTTEEAKETNAENKAESDLYPVTDAPAEVPEQQSPPVSTTVWWVSGGIAVVVLSIAGLALK
eukprot:gene445-890_t